MSLTPSLMNYNKLIKLDFNQIESNLDHNDLNNILNYIYKMYII